MEFMYLVFTRMLSESYRRRPGPLLRSCDVCRALINSLCVLIFLSQLMLFIIRQNLQTKEQTNKQTNKQTEKGS